VSLLAALNFWATVKGLYSTGAALGVVAEGDAGEPFWLSAEGCWESVSSERSIPE
jgi:hypothetical protein